MKSSVLNKNSFSVLTGFRYFSIIIYIILSCSFSGYNLESENFNSHPVSWFKSSDEHFIFKTNIEVLNKKYSGLLVIRETGTDTFRVVMLSEVGLKIFDFGFIPDSVVRVYYIMDGINKKALINTLDNDFGIILMNNLSDKQFDIVTKKDYSNNIIFQYNIEGRKQLYFVNQDNLKPNLIKQKGLIRTVVKANFYGNRSSGIDSVKIKHNGFRLIINLKRIQEESGNDIN